MADVLLLPTAYFYAEKDELAEAIKLFDSVNR